MYSANHMLVSPSIYRGKDALETSLTQFIVLVACRPRKFGHTHAHLGKVRKYETNEQLQIPDEILVAA